MNILSGTGLFMSAKVPKPWQTGVLFLGAIMMTSLPGYYEGILDIRNEPLENETNTALIRKLGFYFLIAGYMGLFAKHRAINKPFR